MKNPVGRPRNSLVAENVVVDGDPEAALGRFRNGLKKALEIDQKRVRAEQHIADQRQHEHDPSRR